MFQIGEYVVYENTGVCRVERVGPPVGIPVSDKERLYYELSPVRGTGTIFIPVDAGAFMRPIITREEGLALLAKLPQLRAAPCAGRDQRTLAEHYHSFFESHDCEDLARLICSIRSKSEETLSQGKKPGKMDLQYQKRAEELLCEELATALGATFEEIDAAIQNEFEGAPGRGSVQ